MRPYVQIGFMPEALSTHPVPYRHRWTPGGKESISTGWAYPPSDYDKWAELVFRWVRHSVERYGKAEVETWYWEVWNEPNILYWRGTPQEYHKLYDHAADAVKRATALGPSRRPARRRNQVAPGHQVPPRLHRSLPARQEPRHGEGGFTAGLRGVPRQGGAPVSSRGTSRRASAPSFGISTGASRSSPVIPS